MTLVPTLGNKFSILIRQSSRDRGFLCCNQDSHDKRSCYDRFGLGWGFLGRDRTYLITIENRQDLRFLGRDIYFYVAIGVGHDQGSLCCNREK